MGAARFELFVALRYLRARREQRVIGFIAAVAVIGVAAGVMALVIALAVNNGFRNTLQRSLLGATPHVIILEKTPEEGIANWRELVAKLGALPHVTAAAPSLYGEVFLSAPIRSAGMILKGIPPDSNLSALDLRGHLKEGTLDGLDRARGGLRGIVLGSKLAATTGMTVGAVARIMTPQGDMTPLGARPGEERFRVVGIFESGFYDLDNGYGFTTLKNAQDVLSTGDVVAAIELKLDDVDRAPEVARAAEAIIGPKLAASHWMEQNRQLLGALRMERTVSIITIGLIQLVAALNILSVLSMSVMEKRRGVAILMSLGAQPAQISRVFLYQGLLLASIGVTIGLILGYGLSILAGTYHWIPLDEAIYSMRAVPFEPRALDGVWISAAALFTAWLAARFPARNAARTAPLEILRYE